MDSVQQGCVERKRCDYCNLWVPTDKIVQKNKYPRGKVAYCLFCAANKSLRKPKPIRLQPISREEIIWAAGLFEGEGSVLDRKRAGNYHWPGLSLCTTDYDVILRFHRAVGGVGTIGGPRRNAKSTKDLWVWWAGGHQETQLIIAWFWPWLGTRRRARAVEVLRLHLEFPRHFDHLKTCSTPGCDNFVRCKGLCTKHYAKQRHAKALARVGIEVGIYNPLKTHCKHGHPFSEENTRVRGNIRRCRACQRDVAQRCNARKKAAS